ncbi:hypothetical protein C356_06458, partial [Cryptococcus neoformans c45]
SRDRKSGSIKRRAGKSGRRWPILFFFLPLLFDKG